MVFANAGISESISFLTDTHDENGSLQEPSYDTIDVNVIAAMNTVKLGWNSMKRQGTGGAIVVTTSATAYAPEQSLPVYSAGKLAVSNCLSSHIPSGNLDIVIACWASARTSLHGHQR